MVDSSYLFIIELDSLDEKSFLKGVLTDGKRRSYYLLLESRCNIENS